ncbi:MAG: MBL fold metallo-hydrolase, partial [Lachnospiraceae bacterium]|nr:MBL fold metallo-hydrolase [Lachnospiraceae bacterium]
MEMFSIASGSSGNSICVGNETTHLLIYAGISVKRIEEGLNTYDYTTPDMDGVLVTHEHGDHICGLGVIARKYGLPIYGTEGTIA